MSEALDTIDDIEEDVEEDSPSRRYEDGTDEEELSDAEKQLSDDIQARVEQAIDDEGIEVASVAACLSAHADTLLLDMMMEEMGVETVDELLSEAEDTTIDDIEVDEHSSSVERDDTEEVTSDAE